MTSPKLCSRSILAFSFMITAVAFACQVPVFRYALERWEPGTYLLTVTPGPGGLSAPEKAILESLQNPATPVNLEVEVAEASQQAASMSLSYPQKLRDPDRPSIWQAALTEDHARRLIDSPARRQLQQRLLSGQSAVWLLLESGDASKDEAAAKTLQESMKTAQEQLQLPDGVITQEEAGKPSASKGRENADVLQSDLPLKIEFSLLRLNRQNPEETAFLSMLMHLEPDLGDYVGEPMAFPIFGRGRALEPLIGAGIHLDNILEAATYLCGACSCEIKDQNPGIDLLLAADWAPVDTAPKVETVRITPTVPADSKSPAPAKNKNSSDMLWGAAAALLLAIVWRLLRRPKSV
jgi:hypothetical protein